MSDLSAAQQLQQLLQKLTEETQSQVNALRERIPKRERITVPASMNFNNTQQPVDLDDMFQSTTEEPQQQEPTLELPMLEDDLAALIAYVINQKNMVSTTPETILVTQLIRMVTSLQKDMQMIKVAVASALQKPTQPRPSGEIPVIMREMEAPDDTEDERKTNRKTSKKRQAKKTKSVRKGSKRTETAKRNAKKR